MNHDETAIKYRGEILHAVAYLDFIISIYIANYFCGNDDDKFVEMQDVILGDERVSLSSKAQILHYLSTEHDMDWVNSYISPRPKQDKKPPYTFNQDLVHVIEERNVFAHRVLDEKGYFVDKEKYPEIDGNIRFARFKNTVKPIDYNPEKFELLRKTIATLISHFKGKIRSTLAPSA